MTNHQYPTVTDEQARRYVERWFWKKPKLIEAVGCAESDIDRLIAAGCAPGIIYSYSEENGWWSTLGGFRDASSLRESARSEDWYSPGAAWGLRRGALVLRKGGTPEEAARLNREQFACEFLDGLRASKVATHAFGECFDTAGNVLPDVTKERALKEWAAWIGGGYAVCLRIFTAETCIRKESLGAFLKSAMLDPENLGLSANDILVHVEQLAQAILPFAPWERPKGTPGKAIDEPLAFLGLGPEFPY